MTRQYFLDGKSKIQIAETFGVSRFKVARIIEECIQLGIVEIRITLPADVNFELSDRLRSELNLRYALVVDTREESESDLRSHLGRVAAQLLTEIVTSEDVLGIGWGRTLSAMADHLTQLAPCPVVQMAGVAGSVAENSMELVRRITSVSGGQAFPIYAPLLLPDAATAAGLRRQTDVAAAAEQFARITKAVIAVGSWDPPNSQLHAAMDPRERDQLRQLGARAEACGVLVDSDGRLINTDLLSRMIVIDNAQLGAIPDVIAVAGGTGKAEAVAALLRAGFVTSVVTDAVVANRLLERTPR
jgi:DNA-binding transcriptional regulator LsrR (DeoR family)